MVVKYVSIVQKFFKCGVMMLGQVGYGNVRILCLNVGGDMKWCGKCGKGKMLSGKGCLVMKIYGY